ncbi:Uncharacterized protein dnm_058240 [Desulfonema magnum]|uniref:Uncharacterized protein n=1 Tax=Desulfonema magnum TaxID=45655 RepID=A0A975BQE1_9BACT|nr:Uncharacterized protein dnm_058240 [Desulfonema magnum]
MLLLIFSNPKVQGKGIRKGRYQALPFLILFLVIVTCRQAADQICTSQCLRSFSFCDTGRDSPNTQTRGLKTRSVIHALAEFGCPNSKKGCYHGAHKTGN